VHANPVYVGASVTLEFLASGRGDATSDVCYVQTKSNYLPSFTVLSVVVGQSLLCFLTSLLITVTGV
jgi:hypothetical protein